MPDKKKFSDKKTITNISENIDKYLLLNLFKRIEKIKIYKGKIKMLYPMVSLNKKIRL